MSRLGGGVAGGGGGGGAARWAQMDQQRVVLEQKKRMYLAKQANDKLNTVNICASSSLNAFTNDGSFLDKFKKLSENKTVKKPTNKINLMASRLKPDSSKPSSDKKDDRSIKSNRDKKRDTSDNYRNKNKSRSRERSQSRDRKYDRKDRYDKNSYRDRRKWESGSKARKRSYSPCTPVVEDMPHRKSRFPITPIQTLPKPNLLPTSVPPTHVNFNLTKNPPNVLINSNLRINFPNYNEYPQLPPAIPNTIIHHINPAASTVIPLGPNSSLNPISPTILNTNNNLSIQTFIQNDPFHSQKTDFEKEFESYPMPNIDVPLHKIPEPEPLDAVLIPQPEPLNAITIPPPKPMNLQLIPPPSPICLTQIPKPKELDLCSIPHPPPNVLSTDESLSTKKEATGKMVAQDLLKTQNTRASVSCDPSTEKYEPEFSLQDNSSSDESENSEDENRHRSENKINSSQPVKLCFDKSKIEQKDSNILTSNKVIEKLDESDSEDEDKIEEQKMQEKMKKRKSRWGDQSASAPVANIGLPGIVPIANVGGFVNINTQPKVVPLLTKITRHDPGLVQYAIKTYGNANLSDEDWKKCEDHYKISLLYQEMLKKRNEIERLKAAGKFKYEYDSDEEIDEQSGTWEHKLRQQEMEATQKWSNELTRQATGKHHIGDFLPPDELKKFMDKYSSVKSGKKPDLSDYKEFKLKEDNIGFKMLQKLGWSEGEGLGVDRSGIVEPINKATQRDASHGLGIERSDDVAENDNEFDAYRKRMMLAYRYRPNPLNNPRRPYY